MIKIYLKNTENIYQDSPTDNYSNKSSHPHHKPLPAYQDTLQRTD